MISNRELLRRICLSVIIVLSAYAVFRCIYCYIDSKIKFVDDRTRFEDCPDSKNPVVIKGTLTIYPDLKRNKFRDNRKEN
jgi:hypothetical protein